MTEKQDECPKCKKVVWIWQKKVWDGEKPYHKKCFGVLK